MDFSHNVYFSLVITQVVTRIIFIDAVITVGMCFLVTFGKVIGFFYIAIDGNAVVFVVVLIIIIVY